MNDTIKSLTEKETALFNAVVRGMDGPGNGWLHELAEESLSTNGTLGSLTKKGLLKSHEDEGCIWVEVTEETAKFLGMEWDGWGFSAPTVEL
jgi:hypothetical protein